MAKSRRYRWRGFGEQVSSPRAVAVFHIDHGVPRAGSFAPATGKQINFLRNLRRRYGIPLSGDASGRKALSDLSRAEASAEIETLLGNAG